MPGIIKNVDCVELYVSDLDEGIAYYRDGLGLKLLWRADTTAGLGMDEGESEVVLQTVRKRVYADFRVGSVVESLNAIAEAGGRVIDGPFDIPIGKCAVVRDKWENEYVILDMTKGRYLTDADGNVTGVALE
ncbi:MAG: VOC family protein [Defluviitaleaceae bacterium]|nr:VOC family protein [Defluviitaleaceae bacterium]